MNTTLGRAAAQRLDPERARAGKPVQHAGALHDAAARMAKTVSFSRSDVGRSPGHVGAARRRPLYSPAITRIASPAHGPPSDRLRAHPTDAPGRTGRDQLRRASATSAPVAARASSAGPPSRAGLLHDRPIAHQIAGAQRRHARLPGAEHVARPAQLEVALGDDEPVGGLHQRAQPRLAGLPERLLVQQHADRRVRARARRGLATGGAAPGRTVRRARPPSRSRSARRCRPRSRWSTPARRTSPAANARMTRSFSSGPQPAVQQREAVRRETPPAPGGRPSRWRPARRLSPTPRPADRRRRPGARRRVRAARRRRPRRGATGESPASRSASARAAGRGSPTRRDRRTSSARASAGSASRSSPARPGSSPSAAARPAASRRTGAARRRRPGRGARRRRPPAPGRACPRRAGRRPTRGPSSTRRRSAAAVEPVSSATSIPARRQQPPDRQVSAARRGFRSAP